VGGVCASGPPLPSPSPPLGLRYVLLPPERVLLGQRACRNTGRSVSQGGSKTPCRKWQGPDRYQGNGGSNYDSLGEISSSVNKGCCIGGQTSADRWLLVHWGSGMGASSVLTPLTALLASTCRESLRQCPQIELGFPPLGNERDSWVCGWGPWQRGPSCALCQLVHALTAVG
jgi:hypothetical protein